MTNLMSYIIEDDFFYIAALIYIEATVVNYINSIVCRFSLPGLKALVLGILLLCSYMYVSIPPFEGLCCSGQSRTVFVVAVT